MKCIALARGFAGRLIEPGEEFDMPDGSTGKWFAPVATYPSPPKSKPANRPKPADENPASEFV